MTERHINGVLLTRGTESVVAGPCNRTGLLVEGSILVTPSLNPKLYDALMIARAVVCSSGGPTGHMQSICRAKGIPVLRVEPTDLDKIVGEVTLDLERQSVIIGAGDNTATTPTNTTAASPDGLGSACAVIADLGDIRGLNASGPHAARVESFFLREEFLCLSAALSPIDALRGGAAVNAYGRAIAEQLQSCVEALLPGQRLILRMLDLRSDDAAHITQEATVAREPNPDMGLHGTRWLLRSATYPQALHVMLETLHERLGAEAGRIRLSAPFLTDAEEFAKLRPHLGLPTETRLPRSSKHRRRSTPRRPSAPPAPTNCSSAPRTWCSSTWPPTAATTSSPSPTVPGIRPFSTACGGSSRTRARPTLRPACSHLVPTSTTTSNDCPPRPGT